MKLSRKCINYSGSTWNFALFSENITPPGKKILQSPVETAATNFNSTFAQRHLLSSRYLPLFKAIPYWWDCDWIQLSCFYEFFIISLLQPSYCLCFAEVAICMELKGSGITFWARDVCDHPLTFHSVTSHPEWLHFKDLQTGKYQLLSWFVSIHSFESFGKTR